MNHTVLVVHDDPTTLARVAARLESGGHEVTRARNAAEARRSLADNPSAVLVTPVRLSDLPAERAAEHFRSHHKDMAVILLVNGVELDEAASMLGRSADDLVLVPTEEARLVAAVDNMLERSELAARVDELEGGAINAAGSSTPFARPGEIRPFHQYERDILLHALFTTGWNVKETATRLKIGRATLYRKIDRYDLRSYRQRSAG